MTKCCQDCEHVCHRKGVVPEALWVHVNSNVQGCAFRCFQGLIVVMLCWCVVPGLERVVNNLKHCVNGEVYNSTLRENHNWIRVKIVTFDKRSFQ